MLNKLRKLAICGNIMLIDINSAVKYTIRDKIKPILRSKTKK